MVIHLPSFTLTFVNYNHERVREWDTSVGKAKRLLCKQEDLTQHLYETPGKTVYVCNSSTREAETGRSPEPAGQHLDESLSSSSMRLSWKINREQWKGTWMMLAYAHMRLATIVVHPQVKALRFQHVKATEDQGKGGQSHGSRDTSDCM